MVDLLFQDIALTITLTDMEKELLHRRKIPFLCRDITKHIRETIPTYLLYLLLTPATLNTSSETSSNRIPIGLVLGPAITALNVGAAAGANKHFRQELEQYNMQAYLRIPTPEPPDQPVQAGRPILLLNVRVLFFYQIAKVQKCRLVTGEYMEVVPVKLQCRLIPFPANEKQPFKYGKESGKPHNAHRDQDPPGKGHDPLRPGMLIFWV